MNNYDSLLSSCKTILHCKILLPILALLALTGCVKQTDFQEEDIRPLPFSIPFVIEGEGAGDHRRHIDGIRQALIDSPEQPVRVLVLHGMITDKPEYSVDMQERIGERLGLERAKNEPDDIDINRGYDFTTYLGPQPFGATANLSKLKKYVWVDGQRPDIPRLIYYEILWYPFRDQIKNFLLSCFESRSINSLDCPSYPNTKRNSDNRALLNGMIKDNVMIKGFGDPMILLGTVGNIIKDDITLSLCIIANDILNDTDESLEKFANERCSLPTYEIDESGALSDAPFFAITYSLGSFLYMDTVQALERELIGRGDRPNNALLLNLIEEMTVYMMANQVSLFQLATQV